MDTDNDGKPDLNLVFLTEWKPTKCVTLGDIQYSSGITAKPEINVDVDNDLIPDLNIDTEGKGKPTMNIDTDHDDKPNLNTGIVKKWKPDTMVDKNGDHKDDYDTDTTLKGLNNIDTDGDGYPDLNIDLDDDGLPDLNINTDGKLDKPQINIDSDGDGIPDINVDEDKDGKPDKNIMNIDKWEPNHNVSKDGNVIYDTMDIKYEPKKELEDNGVIIEKPDGESFSSDMTLKVIDVTKDRIEEITENASEFISEKQEVKKVYEVKLLENGVEVKPDGTLIIRIPIAEGYKNAILIRRNEVGEYEKVNAKYENGYLVYESDTLGMISIIAQRDDEVQGSYYPGANVGGALTGDTSNIMLYIAIGSISLFAVFLILLITKQKDREWNDTL